MSYSRKKEGSLECSMSPGNLSKLLLRTFGIFPPAIQLSFLGTMTNTMDYRQHVVVLSDVKANQVRSTARLSADNLKLALLEHW